MKAEKQNAVRELIRLNFIQVNEKTGQIYRIRQAKGFLSKPKLLKGTNHSRGYIASSLLHEGKKYTVLQHHIIYLSKYKYIPEWYQIHHKDGNKINNCISNLELLHISDHLKQSHKEGRMRQIKGKKHWNAKLDEIRVRHIRQLHRFHGYTGTMLAKKFDVTKSSIYRILRRQQWQHI